MQHQERNNWRTTQSTANPSAKQIPCDQGKEQGILRKSGRLAKSRPSERSKISLLEDNSLEIGTENFIAPNREFIETSRDLQRLAGNCPPRHRFSRN
jgi:hypothetical protein